jgi:hypothetical protein
MPPIQPTRSFSLNVDAAKAQVKNWEPALQIPSNPPQNESREAEDAVPHMITYSTFDPGMTRPLLMSSVILGVIDTNQGASPPASSMATTQSKATVKAGKRQDLITALAKPYKPWPYSLPEFLQPKAGTTYAMMHGRGSSAADSQHIGVLQAVLYGVPEPGALSLKQGAVREHGILHKVLYGVKEVGGKGNCSTC